MAADAWFSIASNDGEVFRNSRCDDLLIYTASTSQSVLIGGQGGNLPYLHLAPNSITVYTDRLAFGVSNNTILSDSGLLLQGPQTSINFNGVFSVSSAGINGSNLIGTPHLVDGCITQSKLSPGFVLSNLAPNSVTEDKIATAAVSERNLAPQCITSDKFTGASIYINNLAISGKSQQPSGMYIGHSNADLVASNMYAVAQKANGETTINSGGANPIRFSVGGADAVRVTSGGNMELNGVITQLSDQRHKCNIHPVTQALDKICQLTGYTFNLKRSQAESAGLLAQEVQRVLPSAVCVSAEDGRLQLDYSAMSCLYVEAIKELYAIVAGARTSNQDPADLAGAPS